MVFPKSHSKHGLMGYLFGGTLVLLFIYLLVYVFWPEIVNYFGRFAFFDRVILKWLGGLLLGFSLIWVMIAQHQMKSSWRIGIDEDNPGALIVTGLFKISRNPIFLGLLMALIGLFLITPNVFTSFILVASFIGFQIQIRLEEEFLQKYYGADYKVYKSKVRRLL